jgi:hypothetical protein
MCFRALNNLVLVLGQRGRNKEEADTGYEEGSVWVQTSLYDSEPVSPCEPP